MKLSSTGARSAARRRFEGTGALALLLSSVLVLSSAAGCEADDPEATSSAAGSTSTAGAGGGGDGGGGGGGPGTCASPDANVAQQDDPECKPLAGDYAPGVTDDEWPACISDDGAYHPFEPNISTIARIAAFEEIADLLGFGTGKAPTSQEFLDARVAYAQDEGLESRVSRREDEHYPKAPEACNEMTQDELATYADRCVGPAKIQPLLNEAFQRGIDGVDPVLNAARIEAGLLWFLYVSVHKEATTCTTVQKDCDSHYAYYTGGEPKSGGLGLSRYVKARSAQAHDRTWDGILAVRCWRDLDNPAGEATNLAMRDEAIAQLDRALLRGLALIVRQRVLSLPCDASWETVKILGPVLDREATLRDPEAAAVLRAEVAKGNQADVNASAVVEALDSLFPCP